MNGLTPAAGSHRRPGRQRRPGAVIGLMGGCWLLLSLLSVGQPAAAFANARPQAPRLRPVEHNPHFRPTVLTEQMRACLPRHLHPVSRRLLEHWLAGRIGTATFRRFFHMPNSDYLPVSACLLAERLRMERQGPPTLPL